MIGALLVALIVHNTRLGIEGDWGLPNISSPIGTDQIQVIIGLLIVVQGVEISRYCLCLTVGLFAESAE